MTVYLHDLTVQQLLNVLKTAREIDLQKYSIQQLQDGLERRGFNTYDEE